MDYRENNGLLANNSRNRDRPRINQFQSSITTLPGPSITIRNDMKPFMRPFSQNVDAQKSTRPTSKDQSHAGQSSRSSQLGDNVSVASSKDGFKNLIPKYYGGKFSRENLPEYNFKR